MSERNDANVCEWEWDGSKWILLSGPTDCTPPLPPRDPPGTKLKTACEKACCTHELSCCNEKLELITLE